MSVSTEPPLSSHGEPNKTPAETPRLHEVLLSIPPLPQEKSALFRIPPEIRQEIFTLALLDFPDPSAESRFDADTCYTRPAYFAPRKSDVRLLRSCRRIFQEAWFLPYILREQVYWLTHADRAPPGYYSWGHKLITMVGQIKRQLGDETVEIDSLRVFAQMYMLQGGELSRLLGTPDLHPRCLTLTVRHTDWWYWEMDDPLMFNGMWIQGVCEVLSPSVWEIHIELETLERKKDQLDSIVQQMSEKWYFRRTDGVVLYPDVTLVANEVTRWTGSSTWHGHTWTRDESRPGQLDYYVVDVVFRPQHEIAKNGGQVSVSVLEDAKGVYDRHKLALRYQPCRVEGDPGFDGDDDWYEGTESDVEEDEGTAYDEDEDMEDDDEVDDD